MFTHYSTTSARRITIRSCLQRLAADTDRDYKGIMFGASPQTALVEKRRNYKHPLEYNWSTSCFYEYRFMVFHNSIYHATITIISSQLRWNTGTYLDQNFTYHVVLVQRSQFSLKYLQYNSHSSRWMSYWVSIVSSKSHLCSIFYSPSQCR